MEIISRIIDLIYPPKCVFCGRITSRQLLCDECKSSLEVISPQEYYSKSQTHDKAYTGVIPSFYYSSSARNAVGRLKFKGNKKCSAVLAEYMEKSFYKFSENMENSKFDIIVPVPMHKSGIRARGYNQAELLAEELSNRLGIEMRNDILLKTKKNKVQHNLSRKKREKNVEGVYSLAGGVQLNGEKILLVDDVITTGNTAEACARKLIEGGSGDVWVFVATTAGKSIV